MHLGSSPGSTFLSTLLFTLLVSALVPSSATATVIRLNPTDLAADFGFTAGSQTGQSLENALRAQVFAPLGIEFEVAEAFRSPTARLGFEGPGLTVIRGSGFVLRFSDAVASVRVRFGAFKDPGDRQLLAFDVAVDFLRDQSGNSTGLSHPTSIAIDTADNLALPPNLQVPIDLTVSDSQGGITSVWAITTRFITSIEEIEVTLVPEPSTFTLAWLGLVGVVAYRRR